MTRCMPLRTFRPQPTLLAEESQKALRPPCELAWHLHHHPRWPPLRSLAAACLPWAKELPGMDCCYQRPGREK